MVDSNVENAAIITSGRYWHVTIDELGEHCQKRAEHHREREAFYRAKADALDVEAKKQMAELDGDEALEAKVSNSYGKRASERETARESSRHHAKLALRFQWLAAHPTPGAHIQLSVSDAQALEFIL